MTEQQQFGFQPVCGDEIVSPNNSPPEECDGPITDQTCEDYTVCGAGFVVGGSLKCTNCQIDDSSCRCDPYFTTGNYTTNPT